MVGDPSRRFEALDGLRGICAVLVALFHLNSAGYVAGLGLVRHGWLFVDFFFVLSGFVIAASYGERLREGFSVARFMALRLGRVYPLHLFMLAVFAAFETFKLLIGDTALTQNAAWEAPKGPFELLLAVSLTQIFGFAQGFTWNIPSWSIAAEVWAYLVMALAVRLAGRWHLHAMAAIGVVCAIWLVAMGAPFLKHTLSFALVRCLYGFSLGMIMFRLWQAQPPMARGRAATMLEVGALVLIGLYVSLINANSIANMVAPLLFALAVLIFAAERGGVSRWLRGPLPRLLGKLSFSIYLLHLFVEARMIDILLLLSRATGLPLASEGAEKMLGTPDQPWMGDAMTLLVLAVITGAATLTYRWIEQPGRNLVRRWVLVATRG